MAEGRSNAAIAQQMGTERAVARHTSSIFTELRVHPSDDDNRAASSPSSPTSAAEVARCTAR